MTERVTISLDDRAATRVRHCAAQTRGGASAYVAKLIRQDELREAGESMSRWYGENPSFLQDQADERDAAAGAA